MEELDNEKYSKLENVENLFKRINRFGNEYNYCFATFMSPSMLPNILGILGAIIEREKRNNITGYFVNKTEREICLIPLIVDDSKVIQIDIDNYIDIRPEEIKNIKIKNEDFKFKRIIITLHDNTKYKMVTAKKIAGVEHHETNLNKFVESCLKK